MIKSFKHRGLERFFKTGSKVGIQAAHAKRLELQLTFLNRAEGPSELDVPGWHLHPLKGDMTGHWSLRVNGNWRLTFRFVGTDAQVVDYQDYH